MQDITHQNLEADLVNASLAQPVLLDIWAPWCGPCKTLGPIAREARGRLRRPLQARSSSTPTTSPRSRSSSRRCSACAASRSACSSRAASRSTASSARCPRPRCAKFLDKHVPSAEEAAADDETSRPPRSCSPRATPTPRSTACRPRSPPTRPTTRRATTTCARCSTPAASPRRAPPSIRSRASPVLDARLAAAGHWIAALEAAPKARPRDTLAGGARRQQARLRRPLRARAAPFRQARVHRRRWTSCSRSSCATRPGTTSWRARPTSRSCS